MKVEGGGAATTTTILHKVKVKEEAKECSAYQQPSSASSTSASNGPSATLSTITTTTGNALVPTTTPTTVTTTTTTGTSNGLPSVVGPTTTTVPATSPSTTTATTSLQQPSAIICHPSPASAVTGNPEPFPVDLDLKAKAKGGGATASRDKSSREEAHPEAHSPPSTQHHQRIQGGQQKQPASSNAPRSEYNKGAASSSDNESPVPSHPLKPELDETVVVVDGARSGGCCRTEEPNEPSSGLSNGTARSIGGVFAGHGKLKRLLGTLVQFATDISPDTGDTVRTLVLALLSGSMTAEEFHSALQDATNFPLRGFVLPYLKHTLPSLQRDLNSAARASNQSCGQFLRTNESAVLEAVGLVPAGEPGEIFGEHGAIGPGNQCSAHYGMRSNSSAGVVGAIQHTNNAGLHHYSTASAGHAPKRRASDTPYYENGGLLDDVPVYGKRSTNPWSHHHSQQQQQQQHQSESSSSYCWYHPLHSSAGPIQAHGQGHGHGHGHGPSPVPPSLVQINQINAFSGPHHLAQQPQQQQQQQQQQLGHAQNGAGSLDDEWKNIHVMLNCILGMVEKTKRALAILQRRGCSSPASAAPVASSAVGSQNGSSNPNNNPSSTNGSQVESSTGDRDGSLKRLSGEIVAQTIRATEDRVAEVKRKAEEAVLEVKRAAVAEVQRAVAVAVAESRASERLRVHRLLDLPLSQRNHTLRQGPFLRVHPPGTGVESGPRSGATPTTTTTSGPVPSTTEDEKDSHLQSISGSSCWNCGRPALETCGGCGIARYCGSFCQHRDWEAGGHHASCNNPPPREPRRSTSRSPPRIAAASVTELEVPPATASKGK